MCFTGSCGGQTENSNWINIEHCACTFTCVCLPACIYFSLKGKEIGSATWERGHVGSEETQGAVCLQLPWASRAWNEVPSCSDYRSSSSNCCVCEDSVICHSSEMPITHHHPALVSTIVLAKVTPFPTSLDFQKSSLSAFYWFALRTGCPLSCVQRPCHPGIADWSTQLGTWPKLGKYSSFSLELQNQKKQWGRLFVFYASCDA